MRLYTGNRRDANEHRAFFLPLQSGPRVQINDGNYRAKKIENMTSFKVIFFNKKVV